MSKRREFRPAGIDTLEDRVVLSTAHVVSALAVTPLAGSVQAQNQAYIQSLYTFTGITPTTAGVAYHTQLLNSGNASRYQVAQTFLGTTQSINSETTGLFQRLLGRNPSQADLNAFAKNNNGNSHSLIIEASQILASPEFFNNNGGTNQGYVTAVYGFVFGRTPDPAAQSWVNALNHGASRQQVALQILRSPEGASSLVAQAYNTVLHRAPDPGSQPFVNSIVQGGSYENVVASLLASPEYYNGVQPGGPLA